MEFKYFLDNSSGWAGVSFKSGSFSEVYQVSYCLGDNLTDLLGGTIALFNINGESKINSELEDKYLDENDIFRWVIDQEGSIIKFIFSLTNDTKRINLQIIEYYEEEECVFNEEIDTIELLDNIIESCNEILTKYGIIGYYNNFWIEFPILYFLLLKNYDKRQLIFDTFEEKCPHNKIVEMHKTNLNIELNYLANK